MYLNCRLVCGLATPSLSASNVCSSVSSRQLLTLMCLYTAQLGGITAPTLITFGALDPICSVRFADPLQQGIAQSELFVFEGCAHAPLYEKVEEFNQRTLDFLQRHAEVTVPA
jgi:pimeloyl-ACP methyl ester carboxylesterase